MHIHSSTFDECRIGVFGYASNQKVSGMTKRYLTVSQIPGKFYVSESWQRRSAGPDGEVMSQHEHDRRLHETVLAGPFDTRTDAEMWNTKNADGHAAIWQC